MYVILDLSKMLVINQKQITSDQSDRLGVQKLDQILIYIIYNNYQFLLRLSNFIIGSFNFFLHLFYFIAQLLLKYMMANEQIGTESGM